MMPYAYLRVAEDLLRRIQAQEWHVGDRLPALSELELQYPASRMTLYKALQHLAGQGYVTISQRRGTFVKAMRIHQRLCLLAGHAILGPVVSPFVFQTFRQANALLTTYGFDPQLYTEQPGMEHGLPNGLLAELASRQFAGVLTIETNASRRYLRQQLENMPSLPWVHIGTLHQVSREAPYHLYVDRDAFFAQALGIARASRRQRVMLLEREEHLANDIRQFQHRCAAHGLTAGAYPARMPLSALSYEEYGYEALRCVWAASARPEVVISPDDVIAKGIAQAALALGIRVPEELQIIVLANRGMPIFYPVPVTRLDVDIAALVARAVDILLALMAGTDMPAQKILMPPTAVAPDIANSLPS